MRPWAAGQVRDRHEVSAMSGAMRSALEAGSFANDVSQAAAAACGALPKLHGSRDGRRLLSVPILARSEMLDRAVHCVRVAISPHRSNRIVVGRSRLKTLDAHPKHGLVTGRIQPDRRLGRLQSLIVSKTRVTGLHHWLICLLCSHLVSRTPKSATSLH
jgi:hypothetical protein